MINNKKHLKDYMMEFCDFNSEYFFRTLISNNSSLNFSKETLIQYLLLFNKINNPDIKLDENILDDWCASHFLELYIRHTDLPDKDLNKILLDLFVLPKLKCMTFTQEGSKKLMRVAELTNEFYYEHVDRLGKYYNILKKNNPNLKDDGAKLLTVINKEPSSLERDIDTKFNLSSKEIFNLSPKYFITHHYHFNWSAIHNKYSDLLCKKIEDLFNNEKEMMEALNSVNNSNYNVSYFLSEIKDLNIFKNYRDYEEKAIQFVILNINNITTMDELLREILFISERLPYEIRHSSYAIKKIQEKISSLFNFDFNYEWISTIIYQYRSCGKGKDRVFKVIEEFENAKRNGENILVSFDLLKASFLKIKE